MRCVELRLRDILTAIENIQRHLPSARSDFDSNELVQVWIVHHCAIIGEACAAIPEEFRSVHTRVPWQSIVGMRNKLIHQYFGIDRDVVWNTVTTDLPNLRQQVETLLVEYLGKSRPTDASSGPRGPRPGGDRD